MSDGPVVLLIGDVALAHDIGGLMAARRSGLSLTIVLLNNDGGGIFEFLPIAGARDAFEEHIATPHGLDFAHAAALYGCQHEHVSTVAQLRAGLDGHCRGPGRRSSRCAPIGARTSRCTARRGGGDARLTAVRSARPASSVPGGAGPGRARPATRAGRRAPPAASEPAQPAVPCRNAADLATSGLR